MQVEEYPKVQNIAKVEGLLRGRTVVVQEKLDGSNVAIRRVDGALVYQSRTQILDPSDRKGIFGPFLAWAATMDAAGAFERLMEGEILYGESINGQGKVKYPMPHPFVLFDYKTQDGFVPVTEFWAQTFGTEQVPFLLAGVWGMDIDTDRLKDMLANNASTFGGKLKDRSTPEGLVVKSYPTTEEQELHGGIPHAFSVDTPEGVLEKLYRYPFLGGKLVVEEFKETKSGKSSPKSSEDPIGLIVDTFLTPARFDKMVQRVVEEGGNPIERPHLLVAKMGKDIKEEEEEAIRDMLFKANWSVISKRIAQRTLEMAEEMPREKG